MMADDSSWDINDYHNKFEPKEHWELKREFLLAHKDTIGEDKLASLAQMYVNMELLGCRYPTPVSNQVRELSKGLGANYRDSRQNKLQRTFVKASDAVLAKLRKEDPVTSKRRRDLTINEEDTSDKTTERKTLHFNSVTEESSSGLQSSGSNQPVARIGGVLKERAHVNISCPEQPQLPKKRKRNKVTLNANKSEQHLNGLDASSTEDQKEDCVAHDGVKKKKKRRTHVTTSCPEELLSPKQKKKDKSEQHASSTEDQNIDCLAHDGVKKKKRTHVTTSCPHEPLSPPKTKKDKSEQYASSTEDQKEDCVAHDGVKKKKKRTHVTTSCPEEPLLPKKKKKGKAEQHASSTEGQEEDCVEHDGVKKKKRTTNCPEEPLSPKKRKKDEWEQHASSTEDQEEDSVAHDVVKKKRRTHVTTSCPEELLLPKKKKKDKSQQHASSTEDQEEDCVALAHEGIKNNNKRRTHVTISCPKELLLPPKNKKDKLEQHASSTEDQQEDCVGASIQKSKPLREEDTKPKKVNGMPLNANQRKCHVTNARPLLNGLCVNTGVDSSLGKKIDDITNMFNGQDPLAKIVLVNHNYANGVTVRLILDSTFGSNKVTYKVEKNQQDQTYIAFVNGIPLESVPLTLDLKTAKERLALAVLDSLCQRCCMLDMKRPHLDAPNPIKTDDIRQIGTCTSKKSSEPIDCNNIGNKMLRMLGWTGGGLGKDGTGRADPVETKMVSGRRGFGFSDPGGDGGNSGRGDFFATGREEPEQTNLSDQGKVTPEFKKKVAILIKDFKRDVKAGVHKTGELCFSPEFTKEQRECIHLIVKTQRDLKSVSFGYDEGRYIVVSQKLSIQDRLLMALKLCHDTYTVFMPGTYDSSTFNLYHSKHTG